MEGDNGDHNMGSGSSRGGAPPTGSRWNPTKEQINMLEGLYRQGIRTPSAEQIKQITSRLQAFGHIEGKNVFYWFQNHKARQRQKQKQENMAYINRFIHITTQPIFPAVPSHHHPYPNVCGPYYLPVGSQADHHHAGTSTFHQQYHPNDKLPPSNGIRRRSPIRLEKLETITGKISYSVSTGSYEPAQEGYYHNNNSAKKLMMSNLSCNQETLPLFPLSPTGLLKAAGSNEESSSHGICSAYDDENYPSTSNGLTPSSSSGVVEEGRCSSAGHDQPFYDFFSR